MILWSTPPGPSSWKCSVKSVSSPSAVLLGSRLFVKKLDVNLIKGYAPLSSVLLWLSCGWPCTERSSLFWRIPFKPRQVSLQRWALILPSSARVSFVTYTTVIAVRYPELDCLQDGELSFSNYLFGTQSTHGVSSPSSGMRLLLTRMLRLTLAALLNGYKASSTWLLMRMGASQCYTIAIRWLRHLATPNGSPRLQGRSNQRVSRLVLEWRHIWSC